MQGYRRIDIFKGARASCPLWAPAAVVTALREKDGRLEEARDKRRSG
jgi:hypothetical protein